MTRLPDQVLTIIRAADPLDEDDLRVWLGSPDRDRLVSDIVATPVEVDRRHPRMRNRTVAIAAAGTLVVGGAAAAATTILGSPPPDSVRSHLAELDAGMPPDLRYNPDLDHARAVAATDAGTLYAADMPDGGYCIEAATSDGRPRGGSCVSAADSAAHPIEVIAPLPLRDDAPLLIGGHLDASNLAALTVSFGGSAPRPVTLGLDRYFLIQVPTADRATALEDGARIVADDSAGNAAAHANVPALRDEGNRLDGRQPVFVSTISDGSDLTLVLGIEGRVNVEGAASLDLTYPDGTVQPIPTKQDGTYHVTLPADRRDDFARAFGVLTARNGSGDSLATAPVGSVAAWRARH